MSNSPTRAECASAIRPIFAHHNLPSPVQIEPLAGGMVNHVFVVDNLYVVRFNVRDPKIAKFARETACYTLLQGSIPLPELVAYDGSRSVLDCECLITRWLPGQTLHDAWKEFGTAERERAGFEAGAILARMHQVDIGNGFGRMEARHDNTWSDYINRYAQHKLTDCIQLGCLTQALRQQIERAVAQADWLSSVNKPALIHADYHFSNIHVHNGRVNGVYDFEWATAGDRAFDLKDEAHMDHYNPGSRQPFLAGYQSILPLPHRFEERSILYQLLYEVELTSVAFRYWGQASYADCLKNIDRLVQQLL